MSMFFCDGHQRLEDSDYVGYAITSKGKEVCTECNDEEDFELFDFIPADIIPKELISLLDVRSPAEKSNPQVN